MPISGDKLSAYENSLDHAISIGVLHHIPKPELVIKAVYGALKPGGKFIRWLYGKENIGLYLALVPPLRKLTTLLPQLGKKLISWVLTICLSIYVLMCKQLPLSMPLKEYVLKTIVPLTLRKRHTVVYDQLNPVYAKYYTKNEAIDLMKSSPF